MGIDFRGKTYVRRVALGKRTVKEGEAVAIWDQNGKHRQVIGPALCRMYMSTIRFLERHVAENSEYLRIRHRDGTIEHVHGPAVIFENPVYHLGVSVEKAIVLQSTNSYVVVNKYKSEPKSPDSTTVSRAIIVGPQTFFPHITDTLQMFNWTDKGAQALSPCQRIVNVGTTISRDITCKVQGTDGHSADVGVKSRLRLLDIEAVLNVSDPIAEADSATQLAIQGALQGIKFADLSASLLSEIRKSIAHTKFFESLKRELKQRAACELVDISIGTLEASAALKKLLHQEDEIAASKVKDQIADSALNAVAARQAREQQLEAAKQKHEIQLCNERHEAELKRYDRELERHLEHLRELRNLGVDLTEYLCHAPRLPPSPGMVTTKPKGWLCL